MKQPNSQEKPRKFILVINYYCNMWSSWAHTVAPLTRLTVINRKFKYMQVKQDDFENIERIVACNTLLTYLDFK